MVDHAAYSSSSAGGGWSWIPIAIVAAGVPNLGPGRNEPDAEDPRSGGPGNGGGVVAEVPFPSVAQQADAYRQSAGAGQVLSAAASVATGQRVPAA